MIDHLIFRRRQRQREELQAFLHTLSPEVGIVECCRRALPRVSQVVQLRGTAILLNDGEAVAHGSTPEAMAATTFKEAKQELIERFERQFIIDALTRHSGNVSRAAEEIGMYRQHLQLKLAEYSIDPALYRAR